MEEQEIIFPELLLETEMAVVFLATALDRRLRPLFKLINKGDQVGYWFIWDLVHSFDQKYIVILEVGWGERESIVLGIRPENWEYLRLIMEKKLIMLVTDHHLLEDGAIVNTPDQSRPHAILILDADRGLSDLAEELGELSMDTEQLERLMAILGGAVPGDRPMH